MIHQGRQLFISEDVFQYGIPVPIPPRRTFAVQTALVPSSILLAAVPLFRCRDRKTSTPWRGYRPGIPDMPAVLGAAEVPRGIPELPPNLGRPDCPPMLERLPRLEAPPMLDGLASPDIPLALDRVPGPATLPVPDIPADPPLILALPFMPDALDDEAPGMPPMPEDAPWDPGIPAMPGIPDRTPSPATPRGRVAGMLDIPLLPPIEPALGRFPGVVVPIPDGFAARGGPVDRSPMTPIPLCCAWTGMATTVRARLNSKTFIRSCECRIVASLTCLPACSRRRVP